MCPYTPFAPLGLEFGMDRGLYTFRPAGANTQLTEFVARGPRASQPCAISKDVESR